TPGGVSLTDFTVDLVYDPALLTITAAAAGPGAPGATVTVDLTTPGVARLTFHTDTPVTGTTPLNLVVLTAAVPTGAAPGTKAVLALTNLVVNGGAATATADPGVEVVALFGDANGSGSYTGVDAVRIARLAAGLDAGLPPYPLLDPMLLADTD